MEIFLDFGITVEMGNVHIYVEMMDLDERTRRAHAFASASNLSPVYHGIGSVRANVCED